MVHSQFIVGGQNQQPDGPGTKLVGGIASRCEQDDCLNAALGQETEQSKRDRSTCGQRAMKHLSLGALKDLKVLWLAMTGALLWKCGPWVIRPISRKHNGIAS